MNALKLLSKQHNFLLVWIGQVFSQSGTRMYQIAVIWWVMSQIETKSGLAVGSFMVLGALPAVLFVKQIGRAVDKYPSKKMLLICDFLCCLFTLAVGVTFHLNLESLAFVFATAFLLPLLQAFVDPTLNKTVAELVTPDALEPAVALQSSTLPIASFGGAVLGAVLIDKLGITGVIFLNSVCYAISTTATALARFPKTAVATQVEEGATPLQMTGREFLSQNPLLKKILIGFCFINFFVTPILVVLPVYTKKVLQAQASVLGMLEASFWIGLVLGGVVSGAFRVRSVLRFAGSTLFAFGGLLAVPGFVVSESIFALVLFLAGMIGGMGNVKFISLFQELVPSDFKGRFFAMMQGLISASFPAAFLIFGYLVDVLSPTDVCIVLGTGTALLATYFLNLVPLEMRVRYGDGKD